MVLNTLIGFWPIWLLMFFIILYLLARYKANRKLMRIFFWLTIGWVIFLVLSVIYIVAIPIGPKPSYLPLAIPFGSKPGFISRNECIARFAQWCDYCLTLDWPVGRGDSPILADKIKACTNQHFGVDFPYTTYCNHTQEACGNFSALMGFWPIKE